ncbi:MAG: Arm DNA-binding domain-containing protein [Flavobacteriaceae bacterium]|nr:Arm DNA-binding domain-containing protein [Flavobacteriaceae bacterium]
MRINLLYLVNRHKINSNGICVILCRITLKKQRKVFSTGFNVNPENWNNKKQKALK